MPKKKGMMYNWEYKLKNLEATTQKHSGKIQRMKKSDLKYNDVIDYMFEDELLSQIYNSTWFQYRYAREPKKITKSLVRELKTGINGETKRMIERSLEFSGYPKSWSTAFYVKHKKRIDAMMKRVGKQLLRYIPKKK